MGIVFCHKNGTISYQSGTYMCWFPGTMFISVDDLNGQGANNKKKLLTYFSKHGWVRIGKGYFLRK